MRVGWKLASVALLFSLAPALEAQWSFTLGGRPVQIHSFASQGFGYSNDNNDLTMRTSQGSLAMTDVGVNASIQLTDKLRIGAPAYVRDRGSREGWTVADYRFQDWPGLRGVVIGDVSATGSLAGVKVLDVR